MDRLFGYLLTVLICTVAGLQFVQVITRYVLEIPVMGLEEITVYPTLWLYIAGSVNASRENTQIKANVLQIALKSERSKIAVAAIADLVSVVVSGWLTWWAFDFFRYSLRVWKESPTLYIPTFFADCALFVGLALMTLYAAVHLVRNVRAFVSDAQPGAEVRP